MLKVEIKKEKKKSAFFNGFTLSGDKALMKDSSSLNHRLFDQSLQPPKAQQNKEVLELLAARETPSRRLHAANRLDQAGPGWTGPGAWMLVLDAAL